MSPERDDPTDDHELYEDVPPRSIFAATWFRVVLVLIVLGVFGAVAVPYVLDWMNPPPVQRSVSAKAASPAAPISPLPASESAASSAEKKDPAALPSTATPPALARPEPESKPTPAPKTPAPKSDAKSTTPEPKSAASAPTDTTAKSSMAVTESAPKAAPKTPAPAKTESAPKAAAPAQTESASKPQVVAKAEPKDDTKSAAATKQVAAKATPASPSSPKAGAPFWVQVGAFKDPETAKRVATALRDQNYKVEESETQVSAKSAATAAASSSAASSPAASPGDLYDVHVSGMSVVELTKRLSAKGLAAETSGSSMVVKPSLPLRDAVTLSKDLAVDGLKVQVRRAGSGAVASTPVTTTPAPSAGETLHRVRVGSFADAASARAAAKELEGKGYKPYIARGNE